MSDLSFIIPDSSGIKAMLSPERYTENLEHLLNKSLLHPVADFFNHPGKNIRPLLVQLGYRLAHDEEPELSDDVLHRINQASTIVEMIHSGSLIVDDIQDGSLVRRDGPCMHLKHGLPLALNAGNWLYFHALGLVKKLDINPHDSLELLDDLLELMGKAHLGQAIDLGTKINELDQAHVKAACLTSMELKTGTLMSLALRLGLAIAGKSHRKDDVIELGKRTGLALQMFDDLGNFFTESEKKFEDLKNQRPTWVWASVSEMSDEDYQEFLRAVGLLPDEYFLNRWCDAHSFKEHLIDKTNVYLNSVSDDWNTKWSISHPTSVELLNQFKIILENSYVKKA